MLNRLKAGFRRPSSKASDDWERTNIRVRLPRLWKILLVLALPFFVIIAGYFESFERSGTVGAIIADTMLPAVLIGYLVLVYLLKQRKM